MASIRREVTIHAPAEQLWDALRDVGALHTRLVPGFVTDCLLDGQSRMVTSAQVHAAGANACRVEWIADLLPDELAPAIAGMIEQGLEAMKQNAEQQGGAQALDPPEMLRLGSSASASKGTRMLGDRRSFLRSLALLGFASPLLASCVRAPPRARLHRIGFINGDIPSLTAAFVGELRHLGYVEGQNIQIAMRLLSGTPGELQRNVDELVRMDLELIVAGALPMALAVREANPAMPMVIATCPGMVSNGFAQSLERPGGLVTGMDELPPGLTAKRLTLLKTAAPQVSRIALLSTTPGKGGHETQLADAERAAAQLGVSVRPYRAASVAELEGALAAMVDDERDGLVNFQGGLSLMKRQLIVDFAAAHRLPAIYQATLFAEAGGLMAWAPDLVDQFRTAAGYAAKILSGARPGDLPITHPPKYFLTIDAAAARRLGLLIPPALVAQADRILHAG